MATFSVKNIQLGHPKNTNNEKKFDGRKNIFFVLKVFNTAKKKKKIKKKMTDEKIFFCSKCI